MEAPIIVKVNTYKKFRTEYRPFMIKLKEEICSQLDKKTHIFYKMVDEELPGFLAAIGNILDPCPLTVWIKEYLCSELWLMEIFLGT